MLELDEQGQHLLALLVERLPKAIPDNPATFITYKEAHDRLGLSQQGQTYGLSLKHQGLVALADWTAAKGLPAITGLIVNGADRMPGRGYFNLFGKSDDDFAWWADQIRQSKTFYWSPFMPVAEQPPTPRPPDAVKPPERVETRTYRVLRDTPIALRVKALHRHECQVCGTTINLPFATKPATLSGWRCATKTAARFYRPCGFRSRDFTGTLDHSRMTAAALSAPTSM